MAPGLQLEDARYKFALSAASLPLLEQIFCVSNLISLPQMASESSKS